jgi:membrane-bound inhibitor of C-type lysozyme
MTKLKFEQVIPETIGTKLPDNSILTFTLVHSQSGEWVLKPLISSYYFTKSVTVIHKQSTYVKGLQNYDKQQLQKRTTRRQCTPMSTCTFNYIPATRISLFRFWSHWLWHCTVFQSITGVSGEPFAPPPPPSSLQKWNLRQSLFQNMGHHIGHYMVP